MHIRELEYRILSGRSWTFLCLILSLTDQLLVVSASSFQKQFNIRETSSSWRSEVLTSADYTSEFDLGSFFALPFSVTNFRNYDTTSMREISRSLSSSELSYNFNHFPQLRQLNFIFASAAAVISFGYRGVIWWCMWSLVLDTCRDSSEKNDSKISSPAGTCVHLLVNSITLLTNFSPVRLDVCKKLKK